MITADLLSRMRKIDRIKLSRDGAEMKLNDHRGDCDVCRPLGVHEVAAGTCPTGSTLADEFLTIDRQVRTF